VTYFFLFKTDFAAAGYLDTTTSPSGLPLVVFNWAPVQWNEALYQDHYTVRIVTPFTLPETVESIRDFVTRDSLVLTEKFVNRTYKIDYRRSPENRLS
jgi:hypothetical protein